MSNAPQAISLRRIGNACARALSPYDCRRHYAELAWRTLDGTDGGLDLFATLRTEQRAAVEGEVARAKRRVEAECFAAFDAILDRREYGPAYSSKRRIAEDPEDFRRAVWRHQKQRTSGVIARQEGGGVRPVVRRFPDP